MIPGSVLCLPVSYAGLRESGSSRPYLTVIGPPELRFREAIIPQPDLSTRPAAGAPPHPVTEESQPSPGANRLENRAPAAEVRLSAQPASAPAQAKAGTPDEPSPAGAPIIPDDSRAKVRPEDFLPYFQFPGAGANPEDVSSPPVPVRPGQQPPSTATYRQQ